MAEVAKTTITGGGSRAVVETVLSVSDTITVQKGAYLLLRNPTAGALSPNIDGADGTTVPVQGLGNVDVSSGYTVPAIGAGSSVLIPLDTISAYTRGAVTITGGDGLVAVLLAE